MKVVVTKILAVLYVASLVQNAVFAQSPSPGGEWSAFLGGNARDAAALPVEWDAKKNLAWATDLPGYGQSSPVVSNGRIYITSIDGKMKEKNLIHCLDLSGELLWTHESESSIQVENNVYTSRAAPTPVADENGVIAFFESGDVFALKPDKTLRWERHLVADYGKIEGRFGLGGSLAAVGDRVFVLADNEGPSYLAAMSKATGEVLWKADRDSRVAWSSPMILNVEGKPQVVVSSAGTVDGYDVTTGDLLWSIDDVGGNTVASPVPYEHEGTSGRFLVGASPGRNGEASEGAKRSNMAVEVTQAADGSFAANVLWRNTEATSSFGSPIAYRGRAYFVNRSAGLICADAETGETLFKKRIKESCWATPIGAGEYVYFFGKGGATTVINAQGDFEEVAENVLYTSGGGGPGGFGGEIQYGFAVAGKQLLIRTGKKLYCIAQ